MKVRLFFATDVHGSEVCWRKFINSAKHYEVNVLILGGDMTGKAIVPVVENGPGRWQYHMQDLQHDLQGDDELTKAERLICDHGYYPVRLSREQVQAYTADPDKLDELFAAERRHTVEQLGRLGRRAPGRQRHPVHRLPRQRRPAATSTRSWPPPARSRWARATSSTCAAAISSSPAAGPTSRRGTRRAKKTNRCCKQRIESIIEQATAPAERLVLGLHAPPYDTQLDVAPKIDWDTLTVQGQDTAHVGSKAVREIIDQVQPLLSLHGHIHESRAAVRIGRTLAINPGSSYVEGTLSGCVVELDGKSKVKRYRLTMG